MILADVADQATNVLPQYGLAGLVILCLAITVIFLYRDGKAKDKLVSDLQNARLQDAKETRDRLADAMDELKRFTEKIYDGVNNIQQRGR